MTSINVRPSRCRDRGLLARPPVAAGEADASWWDLVADPVRQLEVLVDLLERRLIASDEFDRLRARLVLDVTRS